MVLLSSPRSRTIASLLVYAAVTAVMGRQILANLSTHVASDPGDPLLTAAILHWNASHLPWTEAWYQLPTFYPSRDVLTYSEHLLGLTPLFAPIELLIGDAMIAYNLTTLLTFVLSAAAMYALVLRMTGSAAGAFVAGLAFGFAPFRVSHMPHIQVLAAFWAPLALLGLHAFLETGGRRWLVLYGASWLLQVTANGYMLVFFSLFVGLWVLWFVAGRGRWRDLAQIAAATGLAALPLVPILRTYIAVHERNLFTRTVDEIASFSADAAAVLCAPGSLTFWGWVRAGCRAEGELFPGAALALLVLAAVALRAARPRDALGPLPPIVKRVRAVLLAVAGLYGALLVWLLTVGPWRLELGFLQVSATSARNPGIIVATAGLLAVLLSRRVRAAARRASTPAFYILAAVLAWVLALGPQISLMGEPMPWAGPYAALMNLPGLDSLRAPARFWLITMICLSVLAGIFVAELLSRRSPRAAAAILAFVSLAVLADGWAPLNADPLPPPVPDPSTMRGGVAIELPIGGYPDIAAQWRAILGGWKTVNGYSGYGPVYYTSLINAAQYDDPAVVTTFQRDHDLHVVVNRGAQAMVAMIERQPGAVRVAENPWALQYRLPHRPLPSAGDPGRSLPVAVLRSPCSPHTLDLALDGDAATRWICPPVAPQVLTIELAAPATVTAFVQRMARFTWEVPYNLRIETSLDGRQWREAHVGSVVEQTIRGSMRDPASLDIVVPLPPHEARFLRVAPHDMGPSYTWTIVQAEVRGL